MSDPALLAALGACLYLGFGLVHANREAAICRAENAITGDNAPLWPVWLVITAAWPMLLAQRFVLSLLTLHDCAAARAEEKRDACRRTYFGPET